MTIEQLYNQLPGYGNPGAGWPLTLLIRRNFFGIISYPFASGGDRPPNITEAKVLPDGRLLGKWINTTDRKYYRQTPGQSSFTGFNAGGTYYFVSTVPSGEIQNGNNWQYFLWDPLVIQITHLEQLPGELPDPTQAPLNNLESLKQNPALNYVIAIFIFILLILFIAFIYNSTKDV